MKRCPRSSHSTFEENGTTRHRVFDFKLSERGIDDHHVADASDHFNKGTIVELIGIRDSYLSGIPALASTIALHIVEHCLEYFVLDLMPEVFLTDDDERDPIVLHDVYHQLVKQSITSKFSIKKKPFTITHFLLTSRSGFKHSLHYCADKRVVLTKPLASRIPNLVDPLL